MRTTKLSPIGFCSICKNKIFRAYSTHNYYYCPTSPCYFFGEKLMKYNFDLSKVNGENPFSTKQPLSKDEIFLISSYFSTIAENVDYIPEDAFLDMVDIQKQFESNHMLSKKQISYIENVYNKYCNP